MFFESWQINTAINNNESYAFTTQVEKARHGVGKKSECADVKENTKFSMMLNADSEILNIGEKKEDVNDGVREISTNSEEGCDIGKANDQASKEEPTLDAHVKTEINDERLVGYTEYSIGLQNTGIHNKNKSAVDDMSFGIMLENGKKNEGVFASHHTHGIILQEKIIRYFKKEIDTTASVFPDKQLLKDINQINEVLEEEEMDHNFLNKNIPIIDEHEFESASFSKQFRGAVDENAKEGKLKDISFDLEHLKVSHQGPFMDSLPEKDIAVKNIGKILPISKEGELRSTPLGKQYGTTIDENAEERMLKEVSFDLHHFRVSQPRSFMETLPEKDIAVKNIGKILPTVNEGELKIFPQVNQNADVTVGQDSGIRILKAMPFNSNMNTGDNRDSSLLSYEKNNHALTESFTLVEKTGLMPSGRDSMIGKSSNAESIEGHLSIQQMTNQLPTEMDKGFSRVKIALFPESLGSLDMDIVIKDNRIHIALMADRQDIRQALQSNEDQLKNALQNQGIQVDDIEFLLRAGKGMDSGSSGGHLSWREDHNIAMTTKEERRVPDSSPMMLLTRQAGGTEGSISLFV